MMKHDVPVRCWWPSLSGGSASSQLTPPRLMVDPKRSRWQERGCGGEKGLPCISEGYSRYGRRKELRRTTGPGLGGYDDDAWACEGVNIATIEAAVVVVVEWSSQNVIM